jgi:hypothetical protein
MPEELKCFGNKFGKKKECMSCAVVASCERALNRAIDGGPTKTVDNFGKRKAKRNMYQFIEDLLEEQGGEMYFGKLSATLQYHFGWGASYVDKAIQVLKELERVEIKPTTEGMLVKLVKAK